MQLTKYIVFCYKEKKKTNYRIKAPTRGFLYERGNMTFWGRKRIKIAPGIYLNASSNGLGISAGVKGFRISTNSKGDTYLNAGRYGLYYREKLNKKEKNSSQNYSNRTQNGNDFSGILGKNYKIELMGKYNNIINLNENLLYKEANDLVQFQPLGIDIKQDDTSIIILLLLFGGGIILFSMFQCWFIVIILSCISLLIFMSYKENAKNYNENQLKNQKYKKELKEKIQITTSSEQIRLLKDFFAEIKDENRIYNANNGYNACLGYGTIGEIINEDVPCLKIDKYYMFFTDDRLVIKQENADLIYNILYNNLFLKTQETSAIIKNPDSHCDILSYTYEHTNKDGRPNKRYKENNIIAEVRTWIINISYNDNFNINFAVYDKNIKDIFIDLLNNLLPDIA